MVPYHPSIHLSTRTSNGLKLRIRDHLFWIRGGAFRLYKCGVGGVGPFLLESICKLSQKTAPTLYQTKYVGEFISENKIEYIKEDRGIIIFNDIIEKKMKTKFIRTEYNSVQSNWWPLLYQGMILGFNRFLTAFKRI